MKRASAQEAAAERCRLATLPLLASPHRPDVFPEAFRIAAEAQDAARLGVEAVAGAFEDEAPLFDPAYDDRPNANVAAPRQTERLQRKPEKSPLSMTYAHLCHEKGAKRQCRRVMRTWQEAWIRRCGRLENRAAL